MALIASSNTVFNPFWVKGKHCTKQHAPTSFASFCPYSTHTGFSTCHSVLLKFWGHLRDQSKFPVIKRVHLVHIT